MIESKNNDEKQKLRQDIKDIEAETRELHPLILPRLLCDDVTAEKVASLLAENDGRLAIMSPEGDIFDLMAGRYSKNGPNLGVFLKGHAGDDLRVGRVNKDRLAEFVHKPALSMGLTVQPGVLCGLIAQPKFRSRGLLGRFLYSLPESRLGHRKINAQAVPLAITNS